jgi:hypothetical protein
VRVQMGEGDSLLISIGDACRGHSVDGRRVSEARRSVDGAVHGRWDDVDAEDGTRFVGDSKRRACGNPFGVGVSGGVDTCLLGVIASRGRSRRNEVDGDGSNG